PPTALVVLQKPVPEKPVQFESIVPSHTAGEFSDSYLVAAACAAAEGTSPMASMAAIRKPMRLLIWKLLSLVLGDNLGEVVRLLRNPAAAVGIEPATARPVPVDRPEREPRDVLLLGVTQNRVEIGHRHRFVGLVGMTVHRRQSNVGISRGIRVPVSVLHGCLEPFDGIDRRLAHRS